MNGTVWKFETANFTIRLILEQDYGYRYDGDDENGETQEKLDSGEFVAFNSIVEVEYNGTVVGTDFLGGSVYEWNNTEDFYTAHRDRDFMNRNCSLMKAARGDNVCIGHYFPDMVRSAIQEARKHFADMPKLRA